MLRISFKTWWFMTEHNSSDSQFGVVYYSVTNLWPHPVKYTLLIALFSGGARSSLEECLLFQTVNLPVRTGPHCSREGRMRRIAQQYISSSAVWPATGIAVSLLSIGSPARTVVSLVNWTTCPWPRKHVEKKIEISFIAWFIYSSESLIAVSGCLFLYSLVFVQC